MNNVCHFQFCTVFRQFVKVVAFAGVLSVCLAGHALSHENYGPPSPYQFAYSSQDAEGTHGHSQSSDGRRVQGHYMIHLMDGRSRKVEYHADETGFHAKVVTNELGTESKDAADATYTSSAMTGEQAALQYGHGHGKTARVVGAVHRAKSHMKWA